MEDSKYYYNCGIDSFFENSYEQAIVHFTKAIRMKLDAIQDLKECLSIDKKKKLGYKDDDEINDSKEHAHVPATLKYEFYQNGEFVIVDVFYKNAKPESLSVEFDFHSVRLQILEKHDELVLNLKELFEEIDPENSSFQIYTTKIELKLKKRTLSSKWEKLLKGGDKESNAYRTDYPSSSSKKKNWSIIEKEIEKEDTLNDSSSEVSALFSKIYKDSDDDTRRAMMKSYIESNGTTLSTNWNEVKKGTVSTKPPQGMEPKKNHTNHNQNSKAHRNGIRKPVKQRYPSLRGVDRKFMRNQRFAKRGSRHALLVKRSKATASA
ncbi:Glucose-insensitive transcription protein 7 [Smittium culicis]|uniref:Glucose-insensitive transcription protein 7 n=1 Tax=Smittium culicis TaxID=133412 RepID=A0A1R1Y3N7_9FUNG|nr:Glucose-insensitive transcription protein 7 [Smittium culicis]